MIQSKFEELMLGWNPETPDKGVFKLPLFKGIVGREEIAAHSLLDKADYYKCCRVMWTLGAGGYSVMRLSRRNRSRLGIESKHGRGDKNKPQQLHRFLLEVKDNLTMVDHINHTPLDNRRCNLRLCTRQDNARNCRKSTDSTSSFKGVYNCKGNKSKPWKATIGLNRKLIHLGYYTSESTAAKAYNTKALELFGEFAHLNTL